MKRTCLPCLVLVAAMGCAGSPTPSRVESLAERAHRIHRDALEGVTAALLERGFDEVTVRKVLGGNTLRVLADAQRVAATLARERSRARSTPDAGQPRP